MLLGKTETFSSFNRAFFNTFFNYLKLYFYCERIKIMGMACELKIYRAMFNAFYKKMLKV